MDDFEIVFDYVLEIPENSNRMKIFKKIIEVAQKYGVILYGGAIRSIIALEEPKDLDFIVDDEDQQNKMLDELEEFYNIENAKFYSNYAHNTNTYLISDSNDECVTVDISLKTITESNSDCDVNALYLKPDYMVDVLPLDKNNINLLITIDNIKSKRFTILGSLEEVPERNKSLISNSDYLVKYIKLEGRVAKLLSKGWICNNNIEQRFNPCHIVAKTKPCNICATDDDSNYTFKTFCCNQQFCFKCVLRYIKNIYYNTSIHCPYCGNLNMLG